MRCEKMAALLPRIRALMAVEFSKKGKSQNEISEIMRVSQGAVSQYLGRHRGFKGHDDELGSLVKESCEKISKGKSDFNREVCAICSKIKVFKGSC